MAHRATVLLTGFGPFPGMPVNESARLVAKLSHLAQRRFSAHRVIARVLPTEWEKAPAMVAALYARETPRVALHFGVSDRAKGFVIELQGHNTRSGLADASGSMPKTDTVQHGGPAVLKSGLPADEIVSRLARAGIPAVTSHDAGAYLCNAVLYRALMLAEASTRGPVAGFVHIPHVIASVPGRRDDEAPKSLDWEMALAGGLEIIRTCLGRPPSQRAKSFVKGP